jgi:hypothetical protein
MLSHTPYGHMAERRRIRRWCVPRVTCKSKPPNHGRPHVADGRDRRHACMGREQEEHMHGRTRGWQGAVGEQADTLRLLPPRAPPPSAPTTPRGDRPSSSRIYHTRGASSDNEHEQYQADRPGSFFVYSLSVLDRLARRVRARFVYALQSRGSAHLLLRWLPIGLSPSLPCPSCVRRDVVLARRWRAATGTGQAFVHWITHA